jgi:hypothetical protein
MFDRSKIPGDCKKVLGISFHIEVKSFHPEQMPAPERILLITERLFPSTVVLQTQLCHDLNARAASLF